ncbi:N-acetylmuramidase/lysin [uncultured Mediterranean phage uvDeep-CGR2-AD8-C175]|nr:N-acetylmuramidase/lysin [uncultured Mediterranean phage uvDeep-CGR2-AD8-C175]
MWALVEDNAITKIINNPKGLVIGDTRYSRNIFSFRWTNEEREAIGIYEVVFDNSNKKDETYYNNTNQSFDYADGEVTASYGTATPKLLEDRNETNEDGSPMLDADGNQVVTKGLKSQKKQIIKSQASGLLTPTDWYVLKATDVEDYSVPSAVSTFRANVRTRSNEMETAIDNASDVDALASLYEYTEQADGSYTRPLGEFPTLEI